MQILLTPDQRRRLDAEARDRGVSVARLIREAIDARFGASAPEDRRRALDGIRAMSGRFLAPDELDRIVEEERETGLGPGPGAGGA